ncbi:uncharacterized protein LOC103990990 isoform X1 [Musa acuminata AAA Group]|uniref:uncharacterized protein LOC103990990 isoform X1 n=2 Tax=Musa acuminata AAA Group TaxID=214697 RepID=UPI0031DD0E32
MAWRGSISRSMLAAARSSSPRSPPPVTRLRPALVSGPRVQRHRLSFGPPRSLGALGCAQSFLPLYSVVAAPCLTSHLSVSARACCELSQGTFCRICQDR